MANPQVENGHTQVSNELLEMLCRVATSDYEHRIFWYVIRKTYGYKKKLDWISQSQIAEGTGIQRSHVSRTVKLLLKRNMLIREGKQLGIQKDYEQWNVPIRVTHKKLPPLVSEVTPIGTNLLPPLVPTKEKKETNTKQTHKDILIYWNNQNIIVTTLTTNLIKQMNISLRQHKVGQIITAIDNYSTALHDDTYYYSHRWSLLKFLKQGNAMPDWFDDCMNWVNYTIRKKQNKKEEPFVKELVPYKKGE